MTNIAPPFHQMKFISSCLYLVVIIQSHDASFLELHFMIPFVEGSPENIERCSDAGLFGPLGGRGLFSSPSSWGRAGSLGFCQGTGMYVGGTLFWFLSSFFSFRFA